MSGLVLGVDPGKTGALAVWSEPLGLVDVHDMPDATGHALGALVRELLEDYQPDAFRLAVVEDVRSRPGQSAPAMWRFGVGHGAVLGALGAMAIPVLMVAPSKWKADLRLSKDKNASRQLAIANWPANAKWFARVKDDGRAEAALLALWGTRQP